MKKKDKEKMVDRDLIIELEKRGWVYGYLSGHGDSECVFKDIDGRWLVVADAEKRMIICEPNGKAKEPWEY